MSETNQVTFLSALVHLEKRLRQAQNIDELSYRLANETRNIVHYNQLIVWHYDHKGIAISAVSGVDRVAAIAPFSKHVGTLAHHISKTEKATSHFALSRDEFVNYPGSEAFLDMPWNYLLWAPISAGSTRPCAGMMVLRDKSEWTAQEIKLFEHLSGTTHHAWKALQPKFERKPLQKRWLHIAILTLLAVFICFPVRLSVIAEGEIVPEQMVIVSAPLDGIVSQFHVKPNEMVAKGQLLVSLDQTALQNQLNVTSQAYEVVKAQYQHSQQRAFGDPQARETVHLFKSQMAQKNAEIEYAESLLKRTLIKAPRDGIVMFNDENDWLGRPVITGERILTVATPDCVKLRVLLPVKETIQLDENQPLTFFLNIAPTKPLAATLEQIGYETVLDPALGPVYPIDAILSERPDFAVRIGSRGIARLYGKKVALIYAILRKPLTRLRIFIGM